MQQYPDALVLEAEYLLPYYQVNVYSQAGHHSPLDQGHYLISPRENMCRFAVADGMTPSALVPQIYPGVAPQRYAEGVAIQHLGGDTTSEQAMRHTNALLGDLSQGAGAITSCLVVDIGEELVATLAGDVQLWIKRNGGWQIASRVDPLTEAARRDLDLVTSAYDDMQLLARETERILDHPQSWQTAPLGKFDLLKCEQYSVLPDWEAMIIATKSAQLLQCPSLDDYKLWMHTARVSQDPQLGLGYKSAEDATLLFIRPIS